MKLVENTESRVHNLGGHCILMPGVNQVDDEAWGRAAEIAVVRHYVSVGVFVVEDAAAPAPGESLLKGMSKSKAALLVAKTFDVRQLKAWLEAEGRGTVRSALESQLDAINGMRVEKKADEKKDNE
jgi:hypothetical protein